MLRQALESFGEIPDIEFDAMAVGHDLTKLTSSVLERMTALFGEERPALVLVHGDTTSAMATALAAFYAGVPVGHVEAGLRTFDLDRPFPEEMNRVVIDSFARYLFAPTEGAARNLRSEYASRDCEIHVTGNTGVDALLAMAKRVEGDEALKRSLSARFGLDQDDRRLILVTGHRRESFGEGFEEICRGLSALSRRDDVRIIYPVHLNPSVGEVVRARLGDHPNISLIEPVDYVAMVYLMTRAHIVLTDSGGIQEEAPALGKPVFVMRDVTERPEALATGVASLVGANAQAIETEIAALLDDDDAYRLRARPVFPYGNGAAGERIAQIIARNLFE